MRRGLVTARHVRQCSNGALAVTDYGEPGKDDDTARLTVTNPAHRDTSPLITV